MGGAAGAHRVPVTDAAARLGVEAADPERAVDDYRHITPERLVALAEALFDFHLHDPSSVAFRRLLAVEQFRDPAARVS